MQAQLDANLKHLQNSSLVGQSAAASLWNSPQNNEITLPTPTPTSSLANISSVFQNNPYLAGNQEPSQFGNTNFNLPSTNFNNFYQQNLLGSDSAFNLNFNVNNQLNASQLINNQINSHLPTNYNQFYNQAVSKNVEELAKPQESDSSTPMVLTS